MVAEPMARIALGDFAMPHMTLMVHLELGQSNAGLIAIAVDLGRKLDAHITGIAAGQPLRVNYGDVYLSAEIVQDDRDQLDRELADAHAELVAACPGADWRGGVTFAPLDAFVVHHARAADIVLTAAGRGARAFDTTRRVNIAALVMGIGRPVLVVPGDATAVSLDTVVVGWKDNREARRATLDALPLLRAAGAVRVVEITADVAAAQAHVDDVAAWLARHGVAATGHAAAATGDDAAQLATFADAADADIVVAGAFGHSRLREWVLGGVTRDLLINPRGCALVSH
jgi:nucleotide-binding universal stress UspA family protein